MDYSLEHHRDYIGQPASSLPTPSLVVSLPILKDNIKRLHDDVKAMGIGFRAHVKTLKTLEVSRLMLGNGKYRKAITSTVAEIRGLLPLAKEGLLDEVLYGLPVNSGALPELIRLSKFVKIQLLLDHEKQLELLSKAIREADAPRSWEVFIKLDVGSKRAGVPIGSDRLKKLVLQADESPAAELVGFYCHAGHSYAGRSEEEAIKTLHVEVSGVCEARRHSSNNAPLIVSVGATPTAHAIRQLRAELPGDVKLELHAGNFPVNDQQQVSTKMATLEQQAARVCAEVVSTYPERNEALVNAGTIALTKEASAFAGFGDVVGKPGWFVARITQEHGIVTYAGDAPKPVEEVFTVGDKVFLHCQHVCITAAAFYVYYVVDENDVVIDTWVPWKGW